MSPARESVTVFFDYTCPFAYRAHRWFDHLPDVDASWRPFSLLEHNYRGDGPPVWRLVERANDISLLLFAGHSWVDAERADLAGYRHDVFHAWHEADTDLDAGDVVGGRGPLASTWIPSPMGARAMGSPKPLRLTLLPRMTL
ncbi:MAG: hypothetical protein ACRDZV_17380 [Acidimicrobiia bacterium]